MSRLVNADFGIRQHIRQGAGCVAALAEVIAFEGWKRVFFVCGPSLAKSGAADVVVNAITRAGAEYYLLTDVRPNPESETIDNVAVPAALQFGADVIIALGGGSTLDTAKGVAIVGDSGKRVLDFTIDKVSTNQKFAHSILPLVAIPSTAGTGSEVCKNAVISDPSGLKLVLAHESILPLYAFLDPNFLKSLPRHVAVATAMDTFVQALETLTNRNANDFTRTQSLRSLQLVGKSIRAFTSNPADEEHANNMSLACMYAGFSLGLAGIGQDHVLTHPMSEAPFHIAHGDACAIMLPAVIEYNGLACNDLYRQAYSALTGRHTHKFDVLDLVDWVVRLNYDLRVADGKTFKEWGLNEETTEIMLNHPIVQYAVQINTPAEATEYPRVTSIDDYRQLITRASEYSELYKNT